MSTTIFWFVLLALSPAILYLLGLFALGLKMRYFPDRCPRCGERGLRWVSAIDATIVVNGKRTPDYWTYHRCGRCHVRLKRHRGEWIDPDELEWTTHSPPEIEALGA